MKKVISFILAALIVFSLTACSPKDESTDYDGVKGTMETATILPYRRDVIPNYRYPVLCRNHK